MTFDEAAAMATDWDDTPPGRVYRGIRRHRADLGITGLEES